MHGAAQRVDNCEQQVDFLRKRWLDREQELITVIQEETKRTEEKGELRGWVQITNVVKSTSTAIDQPSQEI